MSKIRQKVGGGSNTKYVKLNATAPGSRDEHIQYKQKKPHGLGGAQDKTHEEPGVKRRSKNHPV
jgi:hypothetical protein